MWIQLWQWLHMSSGDYILKIYDMAIIRHHFSVGIQLWLWLCHPKTIFWKYMIWPSSSIIFRWEFSCDGDYVICRLYFENIWYGHHQASCFGGNSVVTVIMSSEDYILKIYDMAIIRHHFSVRIQLWLWENIWYGHHQASFFRANSVVTVIISSGDYIWKIYDMVITRHYFLFHI